MIRLKEPSSLQTGQGGCGALPDLKPPGPWRSALRTGLVCASFGLWLVFFDSPSVENSQAPSSFTWVHPLKGISFVLGTAGMVGWLAFRDAKRRQAADATIRSLFQRSPLPSLLHHSDRLAHSRRERTIRAQQWFRADTRRSAARAMSSDSGAARRSGIDSLTEFGRTMPSMGSNGIARSPRAVADLSHFRPATRLGKTACLTPRWSGHFTAKGVAGRAPAKRGTVPGDGGQYRVRLLDEQRQHG